MSAYRIEIKGGHKMMVPIRTEEEYRTLRNTPRQQMLVKGVRSGNNPKLKAQLLQICYSCVPGPDMLLKGCKQPSPCVGMDIDFDPNDTDYQHKMETVPDLVLSHREALGLLMLERSANKGYHLVFRRRFADGLAEGHILENQEKNLRWASSLLGVMYDEGAKDITRVFFSTTAAPEDLLFFDPELLAEATTPLPMPEGSTGDGPQQAMAVDATGLATQGLQQAMGVDATGLATQDTQQMIAFPSSNAEPLVTKNELLPCYYNGIPYQAIVTALENQLGGIPEHGSRNQFIFTMACHLRYVCNDDPMWIAQVLPNYGEAPERWMCTIRSACNRSQNKKMPALLSRVLALAKIQSQGEADGDASAFAETPPPMPKRLPPLIKLLISKTPKIYQPAVAHAVFPALGAHLWKTRFRYIDNVEHEATLMNVLMAGTGAGKNCISEPIDCIMSDIRQRDALSLEKERVWKEEMMTKGANKDKKKRPEGLVIQEVDADMTNAAFVLRLSEAEEQFLYVRMNEIDQFDALKTSARSKSQFQIMCLAFDPGNSYGQTRVGMQSVSARVCVRFNWNASTTVQKGKQYFKSVLTDGPLSRINFCTIPEQPIGSDMPIYGTYDAAFHEELRPYIERLNAARGLIECPQALRLAKKLKEENADFARLSQSRTFENLSFRANVIAYLKAMVLYVAQGEQWDRTTEDFIRWSEQYDLWCKMRFFGEAIDEVNGAEKKPGRRGPRNLLNDLPDRFTLAEAIAVRRREDMSPEGTTHMLSSWKTRGYIAEDPDAADTWVKTKKYLEVFGEV